MTDAATREGFDKAQADARHALALAPDLAQAHLALAFVSQCNLDFTQASEAYKRALALAPGKAQVLRESGAFAALMGHFDAGVAATRRAVVLDLGWFRTHGAKRTEPLEVTLSRYLCGRETRGAAFTRPPRSIDPRMVIGSR